MSDSKIGILQTLILWIVVLVRPDAGSDCSNNGIPCSDASIRNQLKCKSSRSLYVSRIDVYFSRIKIFRDGC